MHFAHDTEASLDFVVALANTAPSASASGADELADQDQLAALLVEHQYSGRFDRDDTELAEVRAARDDLRRVWTLDTDAAVAEINTMLRAAHASPHLARHDALDWHLHATEPDAPLGERIRVEAALALVDVIRSGATDRLGVCEADDCDGLFIDLSRNGSKRFCTVRCGNRMNVNAYRERRADAE
ncbi:MAG: CGNR zinc finger domain-containing protein [Leifsonia sp.]